MPLGGRRQSIGGCVPVIGILIYVEKRRERYGALLPSKQVPPS